MCTSEMPHINVSDHEYVTHRWGVWARWYEWHTTRWKTLHDTATPEILVFGQTATLMSKTRQTHKSGNCFGDSVITVTRCNTLQNEGIIWVLRWDAVPDKNCNTVVHCNTNTIMNEGVIWAFQHKVVWWHLLRCPTAFCSPQLPVCV